MQFKFFTSGALAALAAALAITAVPAGARENDRHENARHQKADNGQRAERSRGAQSARPARPGPQAQPQRNWSQQARPQQPQRNWTPQGQQRTETRGAERQRNWSQQARPQQQQRGETRRAPSQWWGSNSQQTERNRTYTDRDRNTSYRNDRSHSRDGNRDGRNWRDGNRDGRGWDRNWRSNNRYDWHRYRSSNRNAYHIGRYYSPYRNYSYRRLSIGFGLDSLFYSSRYWINDPWQYRLPEAYGPYRWVRYYDDALLVDIYSGEVVDVIYDFFW
jgi:hypothetical protein